MKKSFLFLVILLLVADLTTLSGQNRYNRHNRYNRYSRYSRSQPKFGYGVKAGINLASQSSTVESQDISVKNIIGVNAGGYCNYFLFNYLGVQAEAMISGKGAHWSDFYDDMKDILTYIDIPLLIKYQPVKFVNIHAGALAGFRIMAKQKNMDTGVKSDVKDYYNFSEYCLTGGVEANLPNNLNLTIRYVYGLTSATSDYVYDNPWTNNLIQFSIGYRFSGR